MIRPIHYFGDVAQLVEQGPFKAKVPGSNPGISTILYVVNPFLKIEGIFCRAYVSKDLFGNGTQAYMNVYNCKPTTAKVQASVFLTNPNICERITELLEETGFNDNNADKQLLFCMNQYADL